MVSLHGYVKLIPQAAADTVSGPELLLSVPWASVSLSVKVQISMILTHSASSYPHPSLPTY